MTKWTEEPPVRKVWAQSVPYFEKKIAALKKYELTNGEAKQTNLPELHWN